MAWIEPKRIVLQQKPVSDNPLDAYLSYVLCEFGSQYVVWTYNATFDGYSSGHYFTSLEKATKYFNEKE